MLDKIWKLRRGLETVVIMGALALAFCIAVPRAAHAQNLQIFAANHLDFGTNEVAATCLNVATGLSADPVLFYDNTVTTTAATDVMLVTISATGDTLGGNAGEVQCTVDGVPCKTGNIGADGASGAGWVVLERNESDEPDNSVKYTWCVPIEKTKKNKHEVKLSLANLADGNCPNSVFLEQINVLVEGTHFGKKGEDQACTTAGTGEHSS